MPASKLRAAMRKLLRSIFGRDTRHARRRRLRAALDRARNPNLSS